MEVNFECFIIKESTKTSIIIVMISYCRDNTSGWLVLCYVKVSDKGQDCAEENRVQ